MDEKFEPLTPSDTIEPLTPPDDVVGNNEENSGRCIIRRS